jgi:hypothetical protein
LDLRSPDSHAFVERVTRQWFASHSDRSEVTGNDPKCEAIAIARCTDLAPSTYGLGVTVDGEPYCFMLFEMLRPDWCIGHFAKTALPLCGATAFGLNAMLTCCSTAGVRLCNEEQDLGLLGLRTAKQGHRPARFLRKYSVTLADSSQNRNSAF